MKLATPLAIPKRNVLSVAGTPAFQNCLKNRGKKPAMTVQAKDELAQSYMAQPKTGRRVRTGLARVGTAAVALTWAVFAGHAVRRCGSWAVLARRVGRRCGSWADAVGRTFPVGRLLAIGGTIARRQRVAAARGSCGHLPQ
jgi:hypothetical protein